MNKDDLEILDLDNEGLSGAKPDKSEAVADKAKTDSTRMTEQVTDATTVIKADEIGALASKEMTEATVSQPSDGADKPDLSLTQALTEVDKLEEELNEINEKRKKGGSYADSYASSESNIVDMLAEYDMIGRDDRSSRRRPASAQSRTRSSTGDRPVRSSKDADPRRAHSDRPVKTAKTAEHRRSDSAPLHKAEKKTVASEPKKSRYADAMYDDVPAAKAAHKSAPAKTTTPNASKPSVSDRPVHAKTTQSSHSTSAHKSAGTHAGAAVHKSTSAHKASDARRVSDAHRTTDARRSAASGTHGKTGTGTVRRSSDVRHGNHRTKAPSFSEKIGAWFKNLSGLDYLVAITGVAVLVVAIVVVNIFSNAKTLDKRIAEFAAIGNDLSGIGTAGEGVLYATANSREVVLPEEIESEEESELAEYNEKDDEESGTVTVNMNLQSVVKDLKIKFINKKSGKLIPGIPFQVEVTDANGKTQTYTDDDKDGVIYIAKMQHGDAKVKMVALDGYTNYKFDTAEQKINVKETLEYKKIDVADEIKKESQVNVAVEDTAQQTQVEATLTDTVEWVESTKTPIGTETKYVEVKDSEISKPNTKTGIDKLDSLYYRYLIFTENTWVSKAYASENGSEGGSGDPGGDPGNVSPSPTGDPSPSAEPHMHDFSIDDGIIEDATCEKDGKKRVKCSSCEETKEVTIPATGHEYENGKCKKCGQADPNYKPSPTPSPSPSPTPSPVPSPSPTVKVTPTPVPTPTKAVTPTPSAQDKKTVLKTTKGEQLYVKSGDKYVAATAADYLSNAKQKFYKQSTNATGYKYTGWQNIDGATYFFDKNNNKVTGEQVIQGAKYTFDSEGKLQAGNGALGIDVSKWNGSIDWTAVRNSGVSYVIIRCGYRGSTTGALIEDPTFRSNIKGATAAGLKVGVYFFTQATNEVEAVEEASMTLNLISGYKISYPVFLDVEGSGGRGDAIDSSTRTAVINAYCKTIANSGYSAGVYANKTWLSQRFNPGALGNAKIWLAQYNTAPTYGGRYNLWQYTSKGKVGGINGYVDMNLSYLGY